MSEDRDTPIDTHMASDSDLITGAFAREVAGLPDMTMYERERANLAARFGGQIPTWWIALEVAIATDVRGRAGVAERLGVSRPYVSRITNFHIPVAPQTFIDRVKAVYMQVDCPHLCKTITPAQCRDYRGRSWNAISQFEVDHWRACQRCDVRAPADPAQEKSA